ncbi:hypothetical protein MBLNU459_g7768t1 [Dothideomycetes sp. NU459]
MRSDMAHDRLASTDELALTAMVLANYENMIGNLDMQDLFSGGFRHHDGAVALMKVRREQDDVMKINTHIDKHIRRQVSRPLPEWLRDGAEFGERGVELELDRCLVQVLELRFSALQLLRKASSTPPEDGQALGSELQATLQKAFELDHELAAFSLGLPAEWAYDAQEPPARLMRRGCAELRSLFWPGMWHKYADFDQAVAWNRA